MTDIDVDAVFSDWERTATEGDFEATLAALQAVVARLEAGTLRLDEAVRCYEVGTRLAGRCERLLAEAELRISRLDEPSDDDAALLNE